MTVTLNPSVDQALFVDRLRVGDTNRVRRTETDAGGKGVNLSRMAAELGASTLATGFLGGGPGALVREVLRRQGVEHDFVDVDGDTRVNFSVEEETGAPPTTFNQAGPPIEAADWDRLLAVVERLVDRARWVALGGSLPPGAPEDAFATLGAIVRRASRRLALDADGEPMRLGLKAGPDFVKPNDREAARLLGRPVATDAEAVEAARELHARGIGYALISRGAQGAVLACAEGVWLGRSPQVEAKSTIGSGDSFVAGFLCAIERGEGPEGALRLALAAGAATATTDGSEIGRRPSVERLLPFAQVERVG